MKWWQAAGISPIGWAIREKLDGLMTMISTDAQSYRSGEGDNLIPIERFSQPPDKFSDWEPVSESNRFMESLKKIGNTRTKLAEAAAASPIKWAYRNRTDGYGGCIFVKPDKNGDARVVFSSVRRSKNPQRIKNLGNLTEFLDWMPLIEPFGDLLEQADRSYPASLERTVPVEIHEQEMFARPVGLSKLSEYFKELRDDLIVDALKLKDINPLEPGAAEILDEIARLAVELKEIL